MIIFIKSDFFFIFHLFISLSIGKIVFEIGLILQLKFYRTFYVFLDKIHIEMSYQLIILQSIGFDSVLNAWIKIKIEIDY